MKTSKSLITSFFKVVAAQAGAFLLAASLCPTSFCLAGDTSLPTTGVSVRTFAATGGTSRTEFIAAPLLAQPIYAGPVASLTASTVTFSGTPFTSGALSQASSPYFAMVLTGLQAGRAMRVTANTANTLTLDTTENSVTTINLNQAPAFTIAPGDTVQVFPADTLGNFFGDSVATLAVVTGGTSSTTADLVQIYNKSTATFVSYFFNTTVNQWNRVGGGTASANSVILYPEGAVGITRRTSRPAALLGVPGDAPSTSPFTKVTGGNTSVVTSLRYPVDLTLGSLIPTALNLSGFTPGGSLTAGDNLAIYNSATNKWDSYYLNGSTWFNKSGINSNSVVVPAWTAVSVFKRNGRPSPGLGSYVYTALMPY